MKTIAKTQTQPKTLSPFSDLKGETDHYKKLYNKTFIKKLVTKI